MATIKIDVRDGEVTCGASGGHVRLPHGTQITWTSHGNDKKFELEFFQLGLESASADHELVHWPFEELQSARTWPTNTFVGTLKKLGAAGHAPVYKYNVKVGDLLLDPIIIIDKK
jgi:hypothetical protein